MVVRHEQDVLILKAEAMTQQVVHAAGVVDAPAQLHARAEVVDAADETRAFRLSGTSEGRRDLTRLGVSARPPLPAWPLPRRRPRTRARSSSSGVFRGGRGLHRALRKKLHSARPRGHVREQVVIHRAAVHCDAANEFSSVCASPFGKLLGVSPTLPATRSLAQSIIYRSPFSLRASVIVQIDL